MKISNWKYFRQLIEQLDHLAVDEHCKFSSSLHDVESMNGLSFGPQQSVGITQCSWLTLANSIEIACMGVI